MHDERLVIQPEVEESGSRDATDWSKTLPPVTCASIGRPPASPECWKNRLRGLNRACAYFSLAAPRSLWLRMALKTSG